MPKRNEIQDVLAGGGAQAFGSVAQRLMQTGFRASALRTLDVLRKEEWLLFDEAVIEVARQRLIGVADLLEAGLRMDIQNGLGTTQIQWETVSDMDPADISMSGVTDGQRDRIRYDLRTLPLPIIHKEFQLNIRALEASRRLGETLDTTQAGLSARRVSERIEDILFNGADITVSGDTVEGYTNATNRNTGALTGDWSNPVAVTGEQIVQDVLDMIQAELNDNMFGPYVLYVPIDYYNRMSDDYKTNSDRTILERVLAIPQISAVKPSQNLPGGATGQVLLVQMTRDVVDIVVGMEPMLVQWDTHGGMMTNFKTMAIMIPRVKSDQTGQSGIAHFSV